MNSAITAAIMALTLASAIPYPAAGAGETPPTAQKERAMTRIKELEKLIVGDREALARTLRGVEDARSKGDEKTVARGTRNAAANRLRTLARETELAYLKGEITLKSAEDAVKVAEAALAKAAEADKPAAQAKVDAAKNILGIVQDLESRGTF